MDTDHFLQLIVMTALPPVLVLFVFLRNLFVTRCNPFHAATRTTGPALVIVYAVFPISAATIFNTFMIESFDDGNKRLTYDLSFDVTDPRYDLTFKYALTMVRVHYYHPGCKKQCRSKGFDPKFQPRRCSSIRLAYHCCSRPFFSRTGVR